MNKIKLPGLDTYFGGKGASGAVQKIINLIRPHDTLVIPFAGNCALTRHIRRPGRVLVNDLDPVVVAAWQAAQVPGVEVSNLPALDFLSAVLQRQDLGRVVIYCDPPYPFTTRKGGDRQVYAFEMQDDEHPLLLETLGWLPVDCLISTYPNELYAEQLSTWNRVEFQAMTRKGPATEHLYYNYPAPTILHDDRFAGDNYRQREYVKRKAQRWLQKWEKLPAHEQQVLLRGILKLTPKALVRELLAMAPGTDTATLNES